MIAVINTGGANLSSVTNCLNRLGANWELTDDGARICSAEKVILPGVGAAADSMDRLRSCGLVPIIKRLKQPVLGICLGMQILYSHSEEGDTSCLGVISGKVTKMLPSADRTVPHMGWNQIVATEGSSSFQFCDHDYFYFIHSYVGSMGPWVEATAQYGQDIPAIVRQDNFWGAQFHPEKSGDQGRIFMESFLTL